MRHGAVFFKLVRAESSASNDSHAPPTTPYICAGVGASEYGLELDSRLLLRRQHVIQRAQQTSLGGTGDRLTPTLTDSIRRGVTARPERGLAGFSPSAGFVPAFLAARFWCLTLRSSGRSRSSSCEATMMRRGVDLVVLKELSQTWWPLISSCAGERCQTPSTNGPRGAEPSLKLRSRPAVHSLRDFYSRFLWSNHRVRAASAEPGLGCGDARRRT